MKRIIIVAIAILLLLCGCNHQIPLNQSIENIARIELINETDQAIFCTLTGESASQFMNALMTLECRKNLQPREDIGYLQVHIYYDNGDVDFIGCGANGTIKAGETIISGWYYYKESDLLELFNSFTDQGL